MAKQNPNIGEEIRGYKRSCIKEIKETQILSWIQKHRSDHKLEVHESQQTHRKELHHMDLQETIVLRIKQERGSHLATNYGTEGL